MATALLISGRRVDLNDPNCDDITLTDIIRKLYRINRWGGATRRQYSVLEHSVLIGEHFMHQGKKVQTLWGILHDAPEGIIGFDMPAPLKALMPMMDEIEAKLMVQIARKFIPYIPHAMPDDVNEADLAIRHDELAQLMPPSHMQFCGYDPDKRLNVHIPFRPPSQGELNERFMGLYEWAVK